MQVAKSTEYKMGLNHSPKVVTNGLIFAYDAANSNKSAKGKPTTNHVTNAKVMSGWSNYYRTLASSTFVTEFGTTGYRFVNQPSWNGISKGVTIPSTGTYTFSAWFRYLGGSTNNNGATVYVSGYGAGDAAVGLDKSKIGIWQRISLTLSCTNTSFTFYLISYGGTDNGTTSPDYSTWDITMPQVESGSVVTPFVDGTRSTTQSVIDMMGRTTVTTNNLTYNTDGTFSFIGNDATSTITVPLSTAFNKLTGTIGMWVYPTSYSGSNGLFVNRDVNTANATDWFWIGSWDSANVFYFRLGDGSACCNNDLTLSNWSTYCPLNTWTYVTCSWLSSGTSRIYTNGILRTSRSISAIPATNPSATGRIGLGHESPASWAGQISMTKIYDRQLTDDEVLSNFNALRGRYGL